MIKAAQPLKKPQGVRYELDVPLAGLQTITG
jgi:hypothetical protein